MDELISKAEVLKMIRNSMPEEITGALLYESVKLMEPEREIVQCKSNDLISRQAAIDKWKNDFRDYVNALDLPRDDYKGIMEYIDELPSSQPLVIHCTDCEDWLERQSILGFAVSKLPSAQPKRKTGRWVKRKLSEQQFVQNGYYLVCCSECGMETTPNELMGISLFGEEEPHFCPNCGAKMEKS